MRASCIEARVDIIPLATILSYYLKNSIPIRSKSDLLGTIVEHFAQILIDNEMTESFTSAEEAINFLWESGIEVDRGGRNKRALIKQLQGETLKADFNIDLPRVRTLKGASADKVMKDVARKVAREVDEERKLTLDTVKEELGKKPKM